MGGSGRRAASRPCGGGRRRTRVTAAAALHQVAAAICRATVGLGKTFDISPARMLGTGASRRREEGRRRRRKQGREADLWGGRLALAGADGRIWRAEENRGKRENESHTGSAMKRWELSVRVSLVWKRRRSRFVGKKRFPPLSPVKLVAMSAFLLRCPSN